MGAYNKTISHYSDKREIDTCQDLLSCRSRHTLTRIANINRPMRIIYIGTDYLQDSSGILQALGKIGELTYFTKENGKYGQYLSNAVYNVTTKCGENIKKLNSKRLWQLISEANSRSKMPDIVIGQMWAGWMDGEVLSKIREEYGVLIVNIAMDDRQGYWGDHKVNGRLGTFGLIPHIDLALTSTPEAVSWYLKEGCPALFFPEASDPQLFHPMPELQKKYDVSFVGRRYGIREKIVNKLRDQGVNVAAYGSGWGNGVLPMEDVPKLFAQSKIILGVGTVSYCDDMYALKMRDFDAPMSGSLYLTHDNTDLRELYKVGEEIVVYRSIDDCVAKVQYYLQKEVERETIAKAGFARAIQDHTWYKRFNNLFQTFTATALQKREYQQ